METRFCPDGKRLQYVYVSYVLPRSLGTPQRPNNNSNNNNYSESVRIRLNVRALLLQSVYRMAPRTTQIL